MCPRGSVSATQRLSGPQLLVGFTAFSFLPEIRAECLRWPHLRAGSNYRSAIIKLITTPAQRASGSVTLEASPPPAMCPPLPGEHRAGVRAVCPRAWDLRPPSPRGPGVSLVSLGQWTRDEGRQTGLGGGSAQGPSSNCTQTWSASVCCVYGVTCMVHLKEDSTANRARGGALP